MRYLVYLIGKLIIIGFCCMALYGAYVLTDESKWWWIGAFIACFLLIASISDLDDGLDQLIKHRNDD